MSGLVLSRATHPSKLVLVSTDSVASSSGAPYLEKSGRPNINVPYLSSGAPQDSEV